MFSDAKLSTVNYDALLNGWDAQTLNNGVTFDGGNSTYCAGEAARANMISSDGWTITDGGKDCPAAPTDDFVITVQTDNPGHQPIRSSRSRPRVGAITIMWIVIMMAAMKPRPKQEITPVTMLQRAPIRSGSKITAARERASLESSSIMVVIDVNC